MQREDSVAATWVLFEVNRPRAAQSVRESRLSSEASFSRAQHSPSRVPWSPDAQGALDELAQQPSRPGRRSEFPPDKIAKFAGPFGLLDQVEKRFEFFMDQVPIDSSTADLNDAA